MTTPHERCAAYPDAPLTAGIVTRMGVRRCGAKKKECSNELSLLA
jgi:hypothetical protein